MSNGPLINLLAKDDSKLHRSLVGNYETMTWKRGKTSGRYVVVGKIGDSGGTLLRVLSAAPKVFEDNPSWVFVPWINIYTFAKAFGYQVDPESERLYGETGYPIFAVGTPDSILKNLRGVGFLPDGPTASQWLKGVSFGKENLLKPPKGVKNPTVNNNVSKELHNYAIASFEDEVPAGVRGMEKMTPQELFDALLVIQYINKSVVIDVNGMQAAENYGGELTKPIENVFTNKLIELRGSATGSIDISAYVTEGKNTITYSAKKPDITEASGKQEVPYQLVYGGNVYSSGFVRTNNIKSLKLLLNEIKAVGGDYGFINADSKIVDDDSVISVVDTALKRAQSKKKGASSLKKPSSGNM